MNSMKHGDNISIDGEAWRVLSVGATCGERTYVHVAHPTKGKQGKAGFIPVQSCGWFDGLTLHDSLEPASEVIQ
jgi:hypothetical protein